MKAHERMHRTEGSQEIDSNNSHAFSDAVLRLTCGVRVFITVSPIVKSAFWPHSERLSLSLLSICYSAVVKIVNKLSGPFSAGKLSSFATYEFFVDEAIIKKEVLWMKETHT